MRALPFGVPKLMVSTLASGQVKSFDDGVHHQDVANADEPLTLASGQVKSFDDGVHHQDVANADERLTLASGQVKSFVGVRDILMMHSVVDISGINRISRTVLTNAANAMAGMVKAPLSPVLGGE